MRIIMPCWMKVGAVELVADCNGVRGAPRGLPASNRHRLDWSDTVHVNASYRLQVGGVLAMCADRALQPQ